MLRRVEPRCATGLHLLHRSLLGLAACAACACALDETPAPSVEPAAEVSAAAPQPTATTVSAAAPQPPAATVSAAAPQPTAPEAPAARQAPPQPAATPEPAKPRPTAPTSEPRSKSRKRAGEVRDIHPQPGQPGCLEMYGTCTKGPEPICTTSAYYLDCGERGTRPGTSEPLRCVCP